MSESAIGKASPMRPFTQCDNPHRSRSEAWRVSDMASNRKSTRTQTALSTPSRTTSPIFDAGGLHDQTKLVRDLRLEIAREHTACQAAAASAVSHAIGAGRALVAAKSLVGYGNFGRWLAENFSQETGLTERTAQRYMKIAENVESLVEQFRAERPEEEPTSVSELTEEQVLRGHTITSALKAITDKGRRRKVTNRTVSSRTHVVRHDEWLTPTEIIGAVECFLGPIHVDPCAAREHNNALAVVSYTVEDNGLGDACVWSGTVFVNPGQLAEIAPWVKRALEFYEARTVYRAVLMLPAVTDAEWTAQLASFPRAFCQERPIVQCCRPEADEVGKLPHPVMLVALAPGEAYTEFAQAFSKIADVFIPPALPKS